MKENLSTINEAIIFCVPEQGDEFQINLIFCVKLSFVTPALATKMA